MHKTTRIVIIEDHEVTRIGIKSVLSQYSNITIVGEANSGMLGIELIEKQKPDIALVDYYMKGLAKLELIEKIKSDYPDTKVIILTAEEDPFVLRQMIHAGVNSIVQKGFAKQLIDAIHSVTKGEEFLQPELGISILKSEQTLKILNQLNKKEYECFINLGKGESIESIAKNLNISIKTLNNLLVGCRKKLHVKTTKDLIQLYKKFFPGSIL